ncbi:MAG TPA: ABC transporter ATP-binding protein [Spongiibacteraceae bacterium]|jgi:iron complex transport system ATP-binding protein|nr:ABC transporter ATP-binding protein [Spongiibacteraceae bacterium]HUH38227.1 ABC transporter ATP-binding protein [Spongiibacteraceae bacterium]
MKRLVADGVTVRVAGRTLLDGADLTVNAGECLGLIGPNGAGKTTLLRTLANLLAPTAGRVLLDGQALSALDDFVRARTIGYLEQGAPAHWPLTVEAVVGLGRIPHLGRWGRGTAQDAAAIAAALAAAEVEQFRGRLITTLSGGERLRVLLARVFAGEPRLILADEPVAALDPYHQLHIMELLQNHAHQGGAVVAVLHDLNLAARFCDRLCLLHEGRVVATGSPSAVLTRERLRAVYGIDAAIHRLESGGLWVVPEQRKT